MDIIELLIHAPLVVKCIVGVLLLQALPAAVREQWQQTPDGGLILPLPGPLSTAKVPTKERP